MILAIWIGIGVFALNGLVMLAQLRTHSKLEQSIKKYNHIQLILNSRRRR